MQSHCFTLLAILLLQGISSKSVNTYVPGSSPYEDDLVPINLIYANFFQNQSLINGLDMLKINEMYINSFGNIVMGSEFVNVSISPFDAPDMVEIDPKIESKLLGVNKVYLDFFGNLAKINGYTIRQMNKLYLDGFKQMRFNTTSLTDFAKYFSEKIFPQLVAMQQAPLNITNLVGQIPSGFTSLIQQLPENFSITRLASILPGSGVFSSILSLVPSGGISIARMFNFFPGIAFNSIDIGKIVERLSSSNMDLNKLVNLNPGTAVELIKDLLGVQDNKNLDLVIKIFEQIPRQFSSQQNQTAFFNQPAGSFYQDGQFNQTYYFQNQTLFYQNVSSYQFTSPDNDNKYENDLVPLNLMYLNFFQDLALTNAKDMVEINEMYINTFGEIVNGDKFIKVSYDQIPNPAQIRISNDKESKLIAVNRVYLEFFDNFGRINGQTLIAINKIYLEGFQQLRLETQGVVDFGKYFAEQILPNITASINNFNKMSLENLIPSNVNLNVLFKLFPDGNGNFDFKNLFGVASNLLVNSLNASSLYSRFSPCNTNLTVGQVRDNIPSQLNICKFLSESQLNVADILSRLPNPVTLCNALGKIPKDKKLSDLIPQLPSNITFGEIGERLADSRLNFCKLFQSLPLNMTIAELYAKVPKSLNLCELAAEMPSDISVCQFMQQIQNNTSFFNQRVQENFVEFNANIAEQIRSNTNMTISRLLELIPTSITNAQFVSLFPDNKEFAKTMSEMPSFLNLPQLLSVMPQNKTINNLNKELPIWMNLGTSMGLFGNTNQNN